MECVHYWNIFSVAPAWISTESKILRAKTQLRKIPEHDGRAIHLITTKKNSSAVPVLFLYGDCHSSTQLHWCDCRISNNFLKLRGYLERGFRFWHIIFGEVGWGRYQLPKCTICIEDWQERDGSRYSPSMWQSTTLMPLRGMHLW